MMEIVIDTSAVLASISEEPERAAVVAATAGATLVAPESLPWEMGNALSAMFKQGRLTLDQAQALLASYRAVNIHLMDVELERAVSLAHSLRIYAYDAYMIAVAQTLGAPLLSLDRALNRVAEQAGVHVLKV